MRPHDADVLDLDALWDYDRPDETEARFRQLLPQIAPQAELHAELLTQIARAQGLQRRFADAHQTLDVVQARLPGAPGRLTIRYLLERGRVFNSARQPEHARPLFLQAWETALALGEDFYAIDAAHMLGIAEVADQQLSWHLRALERAEQSTDPRANRWLGSLYNNIGWTYHDTQQYDDALVMFQKAAEWRAAQGQTRELRIARWCVARALRSLGRIGEALAMQRALADELAQSGETDGYVYEELAECLLSLERPIEARPYFTLAYQALAQDPWLVEREPTRVARLKQLGEGA